MVETLIVGLDAATPRIVDDLVQSGRLPTLSSLENDGVKGTLSSTQPPMTPQAWTTISTGVNPGRHGIFDFRTQDPETYRVSPVDYSNMDIPTVWDICRARDTTIGVLNFPMASPPPVVDEFFVSGIPTPADDDIAYPDTIEAYLDEVNYRIYPNGDPNADPLGYFEELRSLIDMRTEVTVELTERYDPDIMWTIFMALDWGQHYLWDETIEGREAVPTLYEHTDAAVGKLIDSLDPNRVLVVADHGQRAIKGEVHLNSLLANLGYVSPTVSEGGVLSRAGRWALSALWSASQNLPYSVKDIVKEFLPEEPIDEIRRVVGAAGQRTLHEKIHWPATEAFTYGSMGRVFVHRTNRYSQGIVENDEYEDLLKRLAADLQAVTDPQTGELVFEHVTRAAEVYEGQRVAEGPDLLLIPNDWQYMVYGDFGNEWFHAPQNRNADHDMEGLFMAAGDGIGSGSAHLEAADVAPTLLYLLDLPVLEGIDGEVVSDVLAGGKTPRPKTIEAVSLPRLRAKAKSDEDIEQRLEDLGYL